MGPFFGCFGVMSPKETIPSVQVYGRKKTATAVAHCNRGNGLIKVNGRPLELIEPKTLQYKLIEPVLLLGKAFLQSHHPCACKGRWPHLAGLCYPSGHLKVFGRLL